MEMRINMKDLHQKKKHVTTSLTLFLNCRRFFNVQFQFDPTVGILTRIKKNVFLNRANHNRISFSENSIIFERQWIKTDWFGICSLFISSMIFLLFHRRFSDIRWKWPKDKIWSRRRKTRIGRIYSVDRLWWKRFFSSLNLKVVLWIESHFLKFIFYFLVYTEWTGLITIITQRINHFLRGIFFSPFVNRSKTRDEIDLKIQRQLIIFSRWLS